MRNSTLAKIDALHAKIAELIEKEKKYHDRKHKDQNDLWRSVCHASFETYRHCPSVRNELRWAAASLPRGDDSDYAVGM